MPKRKVKILVIEDEHFLLNFYGSKLGQLGYQAIKASGGDEGIRLAKLKSPDLILLDILMPDIDGYEVLRRVKADKKTKNIPVLILSNLSQRVEVKKGLELGAVEFIVKADVIPDDIVVKIEKYLNPN